MFEYFIKNKFFTAFQSTFLLAYSCTSQLLKIIQEIQKSFDGSQPIDEEVSFYTSLKRFIKFVMKDLSINSNRMEFLVIFLTLLKIT